MQSGTFVASLVVWQEGPARSFDWAQALRPVLPAHNGRYQPFTRAVGPYLSLWIRYTRESHTLEFFRNSVVAIEFKFSRIAASKCS